MCWPLRSTGCMRPCLFADGRDDFAGIVLVDPMPVGFQDFYDDLLPDLGGHPPWLDLDAAVADFLGAYLERAFDRDRTGSGLGVPIPSVRRRRWA